MRYLWSIAALLTFTSVYGSSPFPLAYFKEISLGAEFSDAESKSYIRMWTDDIKVYAHGNGSLKLNNELDNIINELNGLTSTIDIDKVISKEQANFQVYFGSADDWSKTEPVATGWASSAKKQLAKNQGLFWCSWTKYAITKCTIYVDTERASLKKQPHLIREEFTQALGLMNDSPAYPDSIFYGKQSYTTQYSGTDIELIKFLYSGLVTPKMSAMDIDSLLQGITPLNALTQINGLVYRKNFPDLPFTGKALQHSQNNWVSDQQNYRDGKLHGTQQKFYTNGNLEYSQNYLAGERDGAVESFFESGQSKKVHSYSRGKKEGIHKNFYETGQLKASVSFVEGKKDGASKLYYESGQLKVSVSFNEDKMEGTYKAYYKSGQLKTNRNYSAGKLHGLIVNYDIEGGIKDKWLYSNGSKNGLIDSPPR